MAEMEPPTKEWSQKIGWRHEATVPRRTRSDARSSQVHTPKSAMLLLYVSHSHSPVHAVLLETAHSLVWDQTC